MAPSGAAPETQAQQVSQGAPPGGVTDITTQWEDDVKKLFQKTMEGDWKVVVELYKQKPEIRNTKITRSGDTALHIAVSESEIIVVEELVEILKGDTTAKLEYMKDERDNTPLHIAAAQGSVKMCECMAIDNKELIKARNKDGETPLFLAVLHGKILVFLNLHRIGGFQKDDIIHCKRNDGDTILHVAIVGGYYDLACDIIKMFPRLVDFHNAKGNSCLHLLAKHPSSFRSGCNLGPIEQIIYYCMVDPLNFKTRTSDDLISRTPGVPGNYRTCIDFLELLGNTIKIIVANLMPWSTCKKVKEENGPDATRRYAVGCGIRCLMDCNRTDPEKRHDTSHGADIESDVQCVIDCNITNAENPQPVSHGSEGGSCIRCVRKLKIIDEEKSDGKGEGMQRESNGRIQQKLPFPINYITFLNFLELVLEFLLVIFGLGFLKVHKIKDKKRKHEWAFKLMEELVHQTSDKDYNNTGGRPDTRIYSPINRDVSTVPAGPNNSLEESIQTECPNKNAKENSNTHMEDLVKKILNIASAEKSSGSVEVSKDGPKNAVFVKMGITETNDYKLIMVMDKENKQEEGKEETPILVAARMGVKEMVQTILKHIPVAIEDVNRDDKNVVLLAVENRQPHVYKFLLDEYSYKERVFHKLDNDGNSALHLAATCGQNRPWRIHGAALQLQWEIKWYKFVKESMSRHFFTHYNDKGQSPKEVFTKTHAELVNEGSAWLTNTSQHCSVVAALIATVAFATATTVPGGVTEEKGEPVFEGQPAFDIFAIASLVALCFSVTSLTLFLTILTSRYQEADFGNSLPWRLIIGLTSLFFSIASMLIAFCAGHFFVLKEQLKLAAIPVYVATCIPISIFAIAQFPLYLDLLKSTFTPIPQRTYEMTSL